MISRSNLRQAQQQPPIAWFRGTVSPRSRVIVGQFPQSINAPQFAEPGLAIEEAIAQYLDGQPSQLYGGGA